MEVYRMLSRPRDSFQCKSDQYLRDLYFLAFPGFVKEDQSLNISSLLDNQDKFFFPLSAVQGFVTRAMLDEITMCMCKSGKCGFQDSGKPLSGSERGNLIKDVTKHIKDAASTVANLIYMGETRRLYQISTRGGLRGSIGSVTGKLENTTDNFNFREMFDHTKAMFDLPVFELGTTRQDYSSSTRLPIFNEQLCGQGSFADVTRFEIHPDYIHADVKVLVASYSSRPGQQLLFAKKTFRSDYERDEVELERDVLQVVANQDQEHKKHLIDLIAFYTRGTEISLVFPYVEGTLERVFTNQWQPPHLARQAFGHQWIFEGLVGIADGLTTLHRPPRQARNRKLFAFHFDLKPANVLITSSGVFKITDFGQALLKAAPIDGATTAGAEHKVGDPNYAPPEAMPSRDEVKSSSRFSKLTAFASSNTGSAPQNREPHIRHRTFQPPSRHRSWSAPLEEQEPRSTGSAKYDIWSFACVMLEALTFIAGERISAEQLMLAGVPTLLEIFRADRNGPFHEVEVQDNSAEKISGQKQSRLKRCVSEQLRRVEYPIRTKSWAVLYINNISSPLLQQMFSIQASKRPSARRVKESLLDARSQYENESGIQSRQLVRQPRSTAFFD